MSNITLNTRLTPTIDYTRRDEIIFDIMDMIKCPIYLDTTDDMIIFNHQFYDNDSFGQHRHNESQRNNSRRRSGYRRAEDYCLKDPRTGENFNFGLAIREHYIHHPSKSNVEEMLRNRLRTATDEEIADFVPWDDERNFGAIFISYIKRRAAPRQPNKTAYNTYIASLQNTAASMRRPTPVRPRPTLPPTTRTSTAATAAAVVRHPLFGEPVFNVDGISSDSSSTTHHDDVIVVEDDNNFNVNEDFINIGLPDISNNVEEPPPVEEQPPVIPANNTPPSNITIAPQPILTQLTHTSVPPPSGLSSAAPSPILTSNTHIVHNMNPPPTTVNNQPLVLPTPPTQEQNSTSVVANSTTETLHPSHANPILPCFKTGRGAELTVSVLAQAKADGWCNSLAHGKRSTWFNQKIESFFAESGILCNFRITGADNVRRKFKMSETVAKASFEQRSHQNDRSGEVDEGVLPVYCSLFFEYFVFVKERGSGSAAARQLRRRNMSVNRSVIGQQAALSSDDNPVINDTTAPPNRVRGSGEVAGSVVINEVTQTSNSESNPISSDSSTNRGSITFAGPATPLRRTAPNDGRRARNQRIRHYNVGSPPVLPPSTSDTRAINMDRMEMGYTSIAESINNLAYQQRIRTRIDINRDIQQYVQVRSDLQRTGADDSVIAAYSQTLADLQEERVASGEYERYVSSRVRVMLDHNNMTLNPAFDDESNTSGANDTDN